MDDLISRQAAIGEIRKCRFVVDAIEKIRGLPSAQSAFCYGYSIKELVLFASVCRKYGIEESDMKTFANNCEHALEIVRKEQDEIFKRTIADMRGGEHDDNRCDRTHDTAEHPM